MRQRRTMGRMNPGLRWYRYVQAVTGNASQSEIARVTRLTQSTVNRWQHSVPSVESVRLFAAAYHRPVLEAFLAAEFITPEDFEVFNNRGE